MLHGLFSKGIEVLPHRLLHYVAKTESAGRLGELLCVNAVPPVRVMLPPYTAGFPFLRRAVAQLPGPPDRCRNRKVRRERWDFAFRLRQQLFRSDISPPRPTPFHCHVQTLLYTLHGLFAAVPPSCKHDEANAARGIAIAQ